VFGAGDAERLRADHVTVAMVPPPPPPPAAAAAAAAVLALGTCSVDRPAGGDAK